MFASTMMRLFSIGAAKHGNQEYHECWSDPLSFLTLGAQDATAVEVMCESGVFPGLWSECGDFGSGGRDGFGG